MFFKKNTEGRDIALQLLKSMNIGDVLHILQKGGGTRTSDPGKKVELILALCTCNLVQTLKADFIAQKFSGETQGEIAREYLTESLRKQSLVKVKEGTDLEARRSAIMGVVADLQRFWKDEEDSTGSGPGPRYYCVKEVLRRLGGETNFELHDALFEMMYLRHKFYIDFFKKLIVSP